MIALLQYLRFWDSSLVKDTIFWGVLTATTLMFRIANNKDPLLFLRKVITDNIKIAAFLSFVINLTIFGLWIEFVTIPILFLFAGIYAAAQNRKEHADVRKAIKILSQIASYVLIILVIRDLYNNYQFHFNLKKLKEFLLPLLLTLLFIPFLCLINLLVQYEQIATSLKRNSTSRTHYYRILLSALFYFNFNIKGAIRWRNSFVYSNSKESIWSSMKKIRAQQINEDIEPENIMLQGWSPLEAKFLLKNKGLSILEYDSDLGCNWFGKSKDLKLHEDFMTSICKFSINGDKYIVRELMLEYTCYDKNRTQDIQLFLEIIDELYYLVADNNTPYKITNAIQSRKSTHYSTDFLDVSISSYDWPNNRGFDTTVSIKHKNLS